MLKNSVTYFTKNLFQFVYSLINLLQSYNCEQEKKQALLKILDTKVIYPVFQFLNSRIIVV